MNFANKLSNLMKLRKTNGKELSQKTGISRSSICLYLKGERVPKTEQIHRLAHALNTNPAYLLGLTDQIYIPTTKPLNSLTDDPEKEMKRALCLELEEIASYLSNENIQVLITIARTLSK